MSFSTKQEKKIMEEKINKVREVVRNFSTNDIVLALHYFELDVEKTIQAFLQDGYKEALGDWEQKGGSSVKKNKQKKNKSFSATGTLPTPSTKTQPVQNGTSRVTQNGTSSSRVSYGIPNGATVSDKSGGSSVVVQQNSSAASLLITPPPSTTGNAEPASNGGKVGKSKKTINGCDAANGSVNGGVSLAGAEKLFSKQLAESQANILFCFQELRHILAERERELTDQLAKARSQISDDAAENRLQSTYPVCFTYDNSKMVDALMSIGQVLSVSSSGGHSIYESADAPPLPSKAVTNGSHSTNGVENANGGSHSVSNCPPTNVPLYSNNNGENGVGHDYAIKSVEHLSVGQFDPISPPKKTVKQKSMAQVNTDGIVMQSDALSADQLALLQKQIQETLRSQGIDPSVLSEIGVNTVAPRRRGPPGTGNNAGGQKSNGNNKNGGAGNRNGKAATTAKS